MRMISFALMLAFAALVLLLPTSVQAESRIALVIGNSAYEHTGRLANPTNDAEDITRVLEGLNFRVTTGYDLDSRAFAQLLSDFSAGLRDADVALFYYAGHGLQFDEQNFLVPIDARLENQFAVRRETFSLNDILGQMEQAKISLVFIDACRNNPLSETLKRSLAVNGRSTAVGSGLAPVEVRGRDMLVAFAAASGEVADDGADRNSPFTAAVLKHIATPDIEISTALKRVTAEVRVLTDGKQQPEQRASMASEFYMVPRGALTVDLPTPIDTADRETTAFNAALAINTAGAWKAFLDKYPEGEFAQIAGEALAKLEEKVAVLPDDAAPPSPDRSARPLAHFPLAANADPSVGGPGTVMRTNGVDFERGSMYVSGRYEEYEAIAQVPQLDYRNFTVAVDVFPLQLDAEYSVILMGGTLYRWMAIDMRDGLHLTFNNNANRYPIAGGAQLITGQWFNIAVAVELREGGGGTARLWVDSTLYGEVDLGPDFRLDVLGTAYEETDKSFTPSNYSDGRSFVGYMRNLRVYDRAVTDDEFVNALFANEIVGDLVQIPNPLGG
jgi:hypothetical protein